MIKEQQLILLQGLPASGKTTFSRKWISEDLTNRIRVNKDDIRSMIGYDKSKEGLVISIQSDIVQIALEKGLSVIVDDTNFNPIHEERYRTLLSWLNGGPFNIKLKVEFINTSLEKCIARDMYRGNESVGERVIYDMYTKYVEPKLKK